MSIKILDNILKNSLYILRKIELFFFLDRTIKFTNKKIIISVDNLSIKIKFDVEKKNIQKNIFSYFLLNWS